MQKILDTFAINRIQSWLTETEFTMLKDHLCFYLPYQHTENLAKRCCLCLYIQLFRENRNKQHCYYMITRRYDLRTSQLAHCIYQLKHDAELQGTVGGT